MTTVGFDPERTNTLSAHVRTAADELGGITSLDPAAADARRVVALTEHNLRTSWLPLLDRIAASDALTMWGRGLDLDPLADAVVGAMLLARLRRRAGAMRHGIDGRPLHGDADGPWLHSLLAGLIRRLESDPGLRDELLATVAAEPSAAWLLLSDDLDPALRADVLITLLSAVGRMHGMEWEAAAGAADQLMTGLLEDPSEVLRVLGHRDTLSLLAEWPVTDQEVVAEFVHTGLATAVRQDRRLHEDGLAVLFELITLANLGRLDDVGFLPGTSIGVASALGAYAPSFIDTVRLESGTVSARSSGPDGDLDVTLGTYEEVVEFLGAIMRDTPAAQEILGVEIAAMARLAVVGGDGVSPAVRVDTVAEFAQLLQHAAANENEESRLAAAARRAGALDTATLVAFTTSALFLVTRGGNPFAKFVLDRGVKDLVELGVRPAAGPVPVPIDVATATHQVIVTAAVGRVATDPALRRAEGIPGSSRAWTAIEADLEELEELAADGLDAAEVDRRLHQLEADARRLGAGDHLDELLRRPAVHDLTSATARG